MRDVNLEPAAMEDLPQILQLQYLAYQSEAELCQNSSIPPLLQTLTDLQEEFQQGIVLKAVTAEGEIVGSVRGYTQGSTGYIGKLIVAPSHQGRGIGSALLARIEQALGTARFELFTSSRSARNLGLYQKRGYSVCRETTVPTSDGMPALGLVFLEKFATADL